MMNYFTLRFLMFSILVLIAVTVRIPANADDSIVKIGVLHYPPFTIFRDNEQVTGAVVEVIRATFLGFHRGFPPA